MRKRLSGILLFSGHAQWALYPGHNYTGEPSYVRLDAGTYEYYLLSGAPTIGQESFGSVRKVNISMYCCIIKYHTSNLIAMYDTL